jgi:hypothetical protein
LEKVQGLATPVCPGNIDLKNTYYLDVGVRIIHMLLSSWGGITPEDSRLLIPQDDLTSKIQQSADKIRGLGVEHGDPRPRNMLWNAEIGRVMLIDFERSSGPSNQQKHSLDAKVLQEVSSKKKRGCFVTDKLDMSREIFDEIQQT